MEGAQACLWHTERRAHSTSPSSSSTSDAYEAATGAASLQEVQLRSAVVQLISGLGEPDQLREGLRDTPKVGVPELYLRPCTRSTADMEIAALELAILSHCTSQAAVYRALEPLLTPVAVQRVAKAWRQAVPKTADTVAK